MEVCRPKQWPTVPKSAFTKKGYPVYGANGQIGWYPQYTHEKRTVLITCRGATCGTINTCEPFSYVTGNAMALDHLKEDTVDLQFLCYALRYRGLDDVITGTAQPQITRQGLSSVSIPLPPLPEQRRIAAILDRADAIRRKRQEAIRLTEELLRSAFLDMFGDPVTNPKGWEVRRLGDIAEEIRYGTSTKCDTVPGNNSLPVLRIPNIFGGSIDWEGLKYAALPEREVDRILLSEGDTLFVRTNGNPEYIGRCAVFDGSRPAIFASYLIRVRVAETSGIRPLFMKEAVSFPTYRILIRKESKTTAGNYNISAEGLRRLNLIFPPTRLQDEFLEIRNRVVDRTLLLEQNLVQENELFDSLSQRAFRGDL